MVGLATHAEGIPCHQVEELKERDDVSAKAHRAQAPLRGELQTNHDSVRLGRRHVRS